MAKMVMLAEAFVITFLSAWLYEEYISNPFMQAYVNEFVRSDTGATAILGTVITVIAFAITGLVYRAKSAEKIEAVGAEMKLTVPDSTASPTFAKRASPELSGPLHPVVAALKAEIAGTPMMMVGPLSGLKPEEPAVPSGTEADSSPPESTVPAATGIVPVMKKAEPGSQAGEKTGSQ